MPHRERVYGRLEGRGWDGYKGSLRILFALLLGRKRSPLLFFFVALAYATLTLQRRRTGDEEVNGNPFALG